MNALGRMMILAAASVTLAQGAYAQNKTQQQIYEEFKKKAQGDYTDFRRKANEEYANFMKKAWTTYEAMAPRSIPVEEDVKPVFVKPGEEGGLLNRNLKSRELPVLSVTLPRVPIPQPQPLDIVVPVEASRVPVVKPFTVPKVTVPERLKDVPVPVVVVEQTEPQPSVENAPQPDSRYVVFDIFGTECRVRFADRDFSLGVDPTNDAVSDAWMRLTNSDIDNTLYDCLQIRKSLQLSDWAYYLMLQSFAKKCFGDTNEATFLMAYLYCQSGYKMRLARSAGRLYMLVGSKHIIYGKTFHYIDGEDFYSFDCKEPSLQVCNVAFPKEQSMSMYILQEQLFADNPTPQREIKSRRYKDMDFKVSVNKNMLDFYDTYPSSVLVENSLTTWEMYARTPLQASVKAQLYPEMMKRLEGKTQLEAVNRLLNWVQTGFVYEYDDKVWGYDRSFFGEETLYYPYCDCEDRSILLSHLVRDLVGLDVVLVYYPGHLATAVAFTEDVNGDYISCDGKKFVVCDGTYIGASVGMTMPGMDNQKAKVIVLEAGK